MCLIGTLRVA
jgi:hypothetical protein